MSELTEDEREALRKALTVPYEDGKGGWLFRSGGMRDIVPVVEHIIAARTRAVEQERDQAKEEVLRAISGSPNRSLMKQMLDDSEKRLAELEAAVLALADEWDDPDPERGDPDRADALSALVSDPTALDRARQEAVEAALAPFEALHFRRPWTLGIDSVAYGQTEYPDQCSCCRVPWPCLTATFLASARDAAGRSGGEG